MSIGRGTVHLAYETHKVLTSALFHPQVLQHLVITQLEVELEYQKILNQQHEETKTNRQGIAIETMRSELVERMEDSMTIQSTVYSLTEQSLQERVETLTQKITRLKQNNAALMASVTEQKKLVDNLTQQNQALMMAVDELQTENDRLTQENTYYSLALQQRQQRTPTLAPQNTSSFFFWRNRTQPTNNSVNSDLELQTQSTNRQSNRFGAQQAI